MNTHECYVSLEVAKLLKQAGFDWECSSYYDDDIFHKGNDALPRWEGDYIYSAPTLAVAQKWLREVKGYIILVNYHEFLKTFYYSICYTNNTNRYIDDRADCRNTSFEEALEAGINRCLTSILENRDDTKFDN